ncbi:hypothetical protein N7467_000576 [Penicillium canescens]|nr:hypothetical protein N7467_000576 [Penicillium canescens]
MSTLPASWYSSPEMYELERRAIFCRKWLLTTHTMRFAKTGDWIKYNIAGYAFILVKDREGNVNAFHNICRHRAFPVVTGDGGTSRIFSCQYHGWSYGLNGKLAKAPGYQELEGFDKSKNGLLPIHCHIDDNGFIWLNLDADETPEVSFADDFKDIDLQARLKGFNYEDYEFDNAWETTGEYNWKTLAHIYNERYEGQTSSPDSKSEQIAESLRAASTYYFPNATMTVSPHSFFMQRFVPTGPTSCSVRYEVFRNKSSSEEEFEKINEVYKSIMSEDNGLCIEAQKSLNDGQLSSQLEKGPLNFQTTVHDLITEHQKREEEAQKQIWPAQQKLPVEEETSKEDMDFCSKLTSPPSGCCGGKACGAGPAPGPATATETAVY